MNNVDPNVGDRNAVIAGSVQRALATGIELSKRAVRAKNITELQFILVNDTRALVEFDRASLITHFHGRSSLDATNNQPELEAKSRFVERMNRLAPGLKDVDRALVIPGRAEQIQGVSPETGALINEYIDYSQTSCLLIVPFAVHTQVIGHLVMEYFDNRAPNQAPLLTLLNMTPFLSMALAENKALSSDEKTERAFRNAISTQRVTRDKSRFGLKLKIGLAATIALVIALVIPVTIVIGGRAELTPHFEYAAFVQMDGIIDKIMIKEGDSVRKDQTLAELDPKENEYRIREALRLLESYKTEGAILRNLGAETPAKIAESQLIAIKALRAQQEVDFLTWQSRYLQVRSPVDGIVLTRKVESLIGRKFRSGEPFCRIAPHDALYVDVFVRESDVNFVKVGCKGEVYLNFQPDRAYGIQVRSIAPKSESVPGLGGVFRIRAELLASPPGLRPGMMGVAHIDTEKASLYYALTRRIRMKLNEIGLAI